MENLQASLEKLRIYIEREQFKGYDPYDTLNSKFNFSKFGKWIPILAIQVQKRNPINIRQLLGIKKEYNPKAIGLLLHAYSLMYELDPSSEIKEKMNFLFNWLCQNYSKGYSGYCWGYNFAWASPLKNIRSYHPSIVVTSSVGKGIFAYYQVTNDSKALEILRSSCNFILKDLPLTKNENGICFSYFPEMRDCCFNASMLGAEILAMVYSISKEDKLLEYSKKAVDFTISHQHDDGHWDYSIDIISRKQRKQIDFHQGYVLDSLYDFIKYTNANDNKYLEALKSGVEFYRKKQFFEDGRSKWRIPREWPVDIHNQSQGIITFTKLRDLDAKYLRFAETIAEWTINNMQDEEGFFYYQKHRFYTFRIPYMRWSQAWMMLALSNLLIGLK